VAQIISVTMVELEMVHLVVLVVVVLAQLELLHHLALAELENQQQ
jgi:hypothetical protein